MNVNIIYKDEKNEIRISPRAVTMYSRFQKVILKFLAAPTGHRKPVRGFLR